MPFKREIKGKGNLESEKKLKPFEFPPFMPTFTPQLSFLLKSRKKACPLVTTAKVSDVSAVRQWGPEDKYEWVLVLSTGWASSDWHGSRKMSSINNKTVFGSSCLEDDWGMQLNTWQRAGH